MIGAINADEYEVQHITGSLVAENIYGGIFLCSFKPYLWITYRTDVPQGALLYDIS